jgi:NADPH:quinone reductase-like Zn-dependent oxidoreductase
MRAVVVDGYGATPQVREIPEPVPAAGEVKVRVRASSVNGFDVGLAAGVLKGRYEHRFPVILGKDFAGTVEAVGVGVFDYTVGDEVFGVVTKAVITDGGGFGEYLTHAAGIGIARIPAGLDYSTAGVLGLAGAAAIRSVEAIGPASGETVLVSGATGGVGGYVVQLAAASGATVIATATPGVEADHVRALGAHHAVDYHRDLADQVRRIAPAGVDAVVHLAGDGLALAKLLTDGGRIASTRHLDPGQLANRNVTVTAVMANPDQGLLARLATAAAAGQLRAPVARTYRLDEVPTALADFSKGTLGKLAVSVS